MTAPPSIVAALAAVMADVREVAKTGTNEQQGFKFRGIDAVINAVGPVLRKHAVVVVPIVEDAHYEAIEVGQRRTLMRQCTVRVRYQFHGPAGDTIDAVAIGEAMDAGDKATPKAMSVAFRTALLQALCLPTDDPDPDSQVYERAPARAPELPPAVTDPTWLADVQQDIAAGQDEAALRAVWQAVTAAVDRRQCSPDDRRDLSDRIKARRAELAAEKGEAA